ncbi:MAG: BON domain-containing protein [Acidobacteriota bacterium]
MMKSLLSATFAGMLVLAGCAKEAAPVVVLTNSDVERGIQDRLNAEATLQPAKVKVDADVKDNEVTLTGTVSTEAQRTKAVELAQAANPKMRVNDKIDVKPPEITREQYTADMAKEYRVKVEGTGSKIGKSIDDAWIHTKIAAKLATDKDTPAHKINIDVDNNIVTLRGTVGSATAKSEAERIAKETDGVKKVVNRLLVKAD